MNVLIQDLRYAIRQLVHAPGFAITAVLTLALGICATSTILSWISRTLLDPIPGAAHTDRMITVQRGERSEHPSPPLSYLDFVDMRSNTKSFEGFIGYHDDYISITGGNAPERIFGAAATADYFEVMGIRPVMGRTLLPTRVNERESAAEAVLSYALWQNRFGGDRNIVGKSIELNLHPFTIVGVAPEGFYGCKSGLRTDIWIPVGAAQPLWAWMHVEDRNRPRLNVVGLMREGVSQREAANELNVVMQQIVVRFPTAHQGNNNITIDPLWRSPFGANVYMAGTLPILLALAGVLLLLACANVANLLLVRAVARRREFAIRLSMGAGKWVLVRQQMVENLLIAGAGGAVALAAGAWTVRTLSLIMPVTQLPLVAHNTMDRRTMVATIVIAFLTAAIAGLIPSLRAASLAPSSILKDEALNASAGLSKSRLTSGLVIAQMALSLLLLVCAGLFVRSLQNAQKMDPGFDPNNVLVATFDLSPLGFNDETGIEFQRQVLERVKQLPGVQSATVADFAPLTFTIGSENVIPEGYVPHLHEDMDVDRGIVGPGYLATLRTPLLAGRDFTDQDTRKSLNVAIVNQAFVNRYWPGQDAIGKRIKNGCCFYTVVGVAANGKYRRLIYDPAPLILTPIYQRGPDNEVILQVRTNGDPMVMTGAVERTVHALNPNLPLYNVSTLNEQMQMGSMFERIAVTFAGSFGLLALLLAGVGIYGVVAYTSRQRTHEIGIRMALGAGKAEIFGYVLKQGLILTMSGLAAGILAALLLTRFVRNMLYGVGATDWLTFAAVSAVLCLVALVACVLPARRAASVNPMQALRTE